MHLETAIDVFPRLHMSKGCLIPLMIERGCTQVTLTEDDVVTQMHEEFD